MTAAARLTVEARRAEPPEREFSSFRDPSGFLFWRNGEIYRAVLEPYQRQLEAATASGLYATCIADKLLLPFEAVDGGSDAGATIAVLKPRQLSLITYPYEWCFDQLKDAAIATLGLHLRALEQQMILKDASAYNIQFVDGRPCLIDHLSFDLLSEHGMWPAYGQFCRHFLAPLALMSYVDLGLGRLAQLYIDGIPLELAASLLPWRTRLSPGLSMHLHLHARLLAKHAGARHKITGRRLSSNALAGIAKSLLALVRSLSPKNQTTEWGAYYADTNYSDEALAAKQRIVREMVALAKPVTIWDVGANNGAFARAVADLAREIVCMDVDPQAVNANYLACRNDGATNILPLIADCTNPSPAIGFSNKERLALDDRGSPDLIMALALIHHLAISHNLPFAHLARHFAGRCEHLLIEFVAKSDSQVHRLLANRKDIFRDYSEERFREVFSDYFSIVLERSIPETRRTLYLMRRRTP